MWPRDGGGDGASIAATTNACQDTINNNCHSEEELSTNTRLAYISGHTHIDTDV